MYNLNKVQRLV